MSAPRPHKRHDYSPDTHNYNQRRNTATSQCSFKKRASSQKQPISKTFYLIPVLALLLLLGIFFFSLSTCQKEETAETIVETPQESRVSFVAVGDNLPEQHIGEYADAQAGTVGDGNYDYTSLYIPMKPYIQAADLAYVKQETHIGGDEYGPLGWPSFNTTSQMADALVDTGFDMVASASNHSYDWGGIYGAVEYSREVWNSKDVIFTGTARNEEEAATIPVIEKHGITFALLDYTYGVNGYDPEDIPSYSVNFIDKERIEADVKRAQGMADVVLVSMHWGTENLMEIDAYQQEYAQFLADLGVDVVLGSHPHVIGPMDWVEGVNGNQTLVVYSLGNFISNHDYPSAENELEGMMSCEFVKNESGVHIENVTWIPLVNHTDGSSFAVYPAKDYTPELAAVHPVLGSMNDPLTWIYETSKSVIGDDFPIDMPQASSQA